MRKVIGISGKARSGKDTIANYLRFSYGYEKYSFADPLKRACAEMFGIPLEDFYDDDKKDVVNEFWGFSPRRMAQLLGTEGGRNLFRQDIWIKRAEVFLNSTDKNIVIPDVRFENEAEFVRNYGILIHINRPFVKTVESHSSENGINFKEGDILVVNDSSIVDLELKVVQYA